MDRVVGGFLAADEVLAWVDVFAFTTVTLGWTFGVVLVGFLAVDEVLARVDVFAFTTVTLG